MGFRMAFAFVFPGQGAQSVGMTSALAADEPIVQETFAEASSVLGYDLWQLAQTGPDTEQNPTERTQSLMLAAGVATWRVWRKHGGALPSCMAGHSLGKYSPLVRAEALELTAIEMVRFRGQAMQNAVPAGQGAKAAVLGLEEVDVENACREASAVGVVEADAAVGRTGIKDRNCTCDVEQWRKRHCRVWTWQGAYRT
jgi:[acyl-carrier-protein] S-malonyltransferase